MSRTRRPGDQQRPIGVGSALGPLLLALLLLAVGCARRGPSPNLDGRAREVLVVAATTDALSLDPAVAYEFTSTAVDMAIYETLIRYRNSDYTKPLPGLAERWTVSADGLTYTFVLREGLRFASGAPLDAEAVRASLARTLTLNMAPAELLAENLAPDRISVVNQRTVRMRLQQPSAFFLSTLFNPAAAIVDVREALEHEVDGDLGSGWLRDHSAGSGPFVLERWERDISIVLARNERYWGEAPRLRRVIIKNVPESTTQQMMIERGDIDIAYDLNPLQIEQALRVSSHVRAVEVPFLRLYYLGMNVRGGPLSDPRVRQAIRLALDYQGLVDLGRGHALSLKGPVIKGLLGYAPDLAVAEPSLDEARRLLAEAGYADGFDVELAASGGPTNFGPTRDDICARIQHDLRRVGIRVELKILSSSAYLDLYRGGKTQLNMGDWGADYPDPHNFAHPFGHSKGSLAKRVGFGDAALDALIDLAGHEVDAGKRVALYRRVQEALMKDGPWAVLVQPTRSLLVRTEVHGFEYDALSPMDYRGVWKAEP